MKLEQFTLIRFMVADGFQGKANTYFALIENVGPTRLHL